MRTLRPELTVGSGPTVLLRPADPADETFLYELYADRRAPELALLGWDEGARRAFIDQQFRAQQLGYGAEFPKADHWVVVVDGAAVGRLLLARGATELLVVDVVILTTYRGRGIGTALLSEVQRDAAKARVAVHLSVAAYDQRVVTWYERLGFSVVERGDLHLSMAWHPGGASTGGG